jgi:rare lipoprotein A
LKFKIGILLFLFILISGCYQLPQGGYEPYKDYKKGKTRKHKTVQSTSRTWKCSYYGRDFHGRKTANGEVFNMYEVSCAHKTLPFNTILKVTNPKNNRSITVRVNDRGPYVDGRDLDLSYAAMRKLGGLADGVIEAEVKIVKEGE